MADAKLHSQPDDARAGDDQVAALERELEAERQRSAALAQERAELLNANESANRGRDQLLGTLSHELRTPLNAIVGWAHLLQNGELPPAEVKKGLAAILRGAEAQARILASLLDASRIISGNTRLAVQPLELGAVVETAIAAMRSELETKGLTLTSNHAGVDRVLGDQDRLQQVVSTLLANAVHYTPSGGTVEVTVGQSGDQVELRVSDSGSGVAPELLPSFFDDFRDSSASRGQPGFGIGLGLVRRLIELQGGTVTVESAGAGLGTTVVVRVPVAAAETPESDEEDLEIARPTPTSLAGLRVLVAEDDAISRDLILKILDAAGARVVAVASGQEALQIFGRFKPDVLLSDLEMPGTDGYGLIKQLRAQPPAAGGKTPAVALTGFVETEDRARAAGFDQHISKPVGPARLIAVVAELSGRSFI